MSEVAVDQPLCDAQTTTAVSPPQKTIIAAQGSMAKRSPMNQSEQTERTPFLKRTESVIAPWLA